MSKPAHQEMGASRPAGFSLATSKRDKIAAAAVQAAQRFAALIDEIEAQRPLLELVEHIADEIAAKGWEATARICEYVGQVQLHVALDTQEDVSQIETTLAAHGLAFRKCGNQYAGLYSATAREPKVYFSVHVRSTAALAAGYDDEQAH
ncbi:hypothetical protein [Andreprevotia chitinilytica]|uniref:hypothetical protein n=1 Tax=Andreprevotia chitinilytica TaxID=396808 RepID=UPI0012EB1D82|nr:hypothetical protein [Andreprevotia chitinilytica]